MNSTADVAGSAPNFRRRSSTYVDAIHDLPGKIYLSTLLTRTASLLQYDGSFDV